MALTFILEITLAIYTIWRYKWSPVVRLAVLMFVALATFQLAEFMICRQMGGDPLIWSRIGYMAITTLPPLGIHMFYTLVGTKRPPLIAVAYASGLVFLLFFMLAPGAVTGHACLGNYVIFQVAPGSGGLYGAYYYGWLATMLVLCWRFIRRTAAGRKRRAIEGLAAGYAVFLIPATTISLVKPETIVGMPSIMCGFAVLLAIILAIIVLPTSAKPKEKR